MIRRRRLAQQQAQEYRAINITAGVSGLFAPPVYLFTDTARQQQGVPSYHALVNAETKVICTLFGLGPVYVVMATCSGKPHPKLPIMKFPTLQDAVDCATVYLNMDLLP